jgi:hypothetical protein
MKALLNDNLAFVNPIFIVLAFAFIIGGMLSMIFGVMPLGVIEIIIGILGLVFMFLGKNNDSSG